jgi:CheY-like chemotaxis protein
MDGVALAREIRKKWPSDELPLVLLSSLSADRKIDGADFAVVLTKPVKQSQLFEHIQGILGSSPSAAASRKILPSGPKASPPVGPPLQILVADDNRINQMVAVRLLRRLGYRADVVADGLEVLAELEQRSYDVIFMDVQMPEMDGLEATRLIRESHPHGARPYIVAMTAAALQGDREKCLESGMDGYISKPVRGEELAQVLEQYSGYRRQSG